MSAVAQPTIIKARRRARPEMPMLKWTEPGFAPMTTLSCSFAEVPAAALRERDMVRTRAGGFVPIARVRRSVLDDDFLRRHADALPIRIKAGALGPGFPTSDILVSPAQMLAALPGGRLTAPKRAGDLLSLPGVFRQPDTSISYTQVELAKPAEICAHGLWFPVGS